VTKWRQFAHSKNPLTSQDEQRLEDILTAFNLPYEKLNENNFMIELNKRLILQDVQKGIHKPRTNCDFPIPCKLQPNETLLWVFPNVDLIETIITEASTETPLV
jgi:hypothetical protein